MNRSRFASPSTGSALENISRLIQVLAIVVGGAWVLNDYFEFKKTNNQLVNKQAELALATGKLTEAMDELKLEHSKEGRVDVAMDVSIARSTDFGDGTFLYRYYVWLKVKNISEAAVVIPAIVAEYFIGSAEKELKPSEALYVNPPHNFQQKDDGTGAVSWTRKGAFAQAKLDPILDKDLQQAISSFPALAVDFSGPVRSGAFTDIGMSFLIRSRPEAFAGAVLTVWVRNPDGDLEKLIYTNHNFLSDAPDVSELKSAPLSAKQDDQENDPKQ